MKRGRHRVFNVTALTVMALASAAAAAQDYLPPEKLVAAALQAQPGVRAAAARVDAAAAGARAREVGSHEFDLTVIPQQRSTGVEGRFHEWEAQLSRSIRLPSKARLDREIGEHMRSAAGLRLDDAEHQAARRLLELWMNGLRQTITADETAAQQALLTRERDALARRVTLGDAARRDLDLLEAESAQLAVQAVAAGAAAAAARQLLASEFPQLPLPQQAPPLPEPVAPPGDAREWRERIVSRSHEIGIANEDAARLALIAARTRADRTPDPSVGVRVISDRGGAEKVVGLVLNIPIGTDYRSAMAVSEGANAAAADAEAAAVRRAIEQAAWATAEAVPSRLLQWQAQQRSLVAQEAASARTRRGWELGETPLAEYLLAQRNHRQARLAEALARVDALQALLLLRVDAHELWHAE